MEQRERRNGGIVRTGERERSEGGRGREGKRDGSALPEEKVSDEDSKARDGQEEA
jgi:hypothetical protein